MALAKLHNFCIAESDTLLRERFHPDVVEGDELDTMLNEDFLDEEEQHFITTHRSGTCHHNFFRVLLEEKDYVDLNII